MEKRTLRQQVLAARNLCAHNKQRLKGLQTPEDVQYCLFESRKALLGSDITIWQFLSSQKKTQESEIQELGTLLAKWTSAFLEEDGYEELCKTFYRYALHMLASDVVEPACIDGLIQLGDCYGSGPSTFAIVGETLLPKEMLPDLQAWTSEYNLPPYDFSRAVLGAVAVLTGVLPEPKDEIPVPTLSLL